MKYLLTFLCIIITACQTDKLVNTDPSYIINNTLPAVTNCYQKNNISAWHSGKTEADLIVSCISEPGFPQNLLTISINPNEYIETYLLKYRVVNTIEGKTEYKTLDFIVALHWDKRIEYKRLWPYPKQLEFHIDTNDYRIVNLKQWTDLTIY